MRIKIKNIESGQEAEFSTDENHISVQMTREEFEAIRGMDEHDSGLSCEGREHRTFACIRPDGEEEMAFLSEWAKVF